MGRLPGRVTELERVIAHCEGDLWLDLSELRSLDEEGVAAIQALGGRGAGIVGASPYIALLIGTPISIPWDGSEGRGSPVRDRGKRER